jgi:hypothetical protein
MSLRRYTWSVFGLFAGCMAQLRGLELHRRLEQSPRPGTSETSSYVLSRPRPSWSREGRPPGPPSFERCLECRLAAISRTEIHFHDLRGAGLTWAATQGATTRELMARAGHASPATHCVVSTPPQTETRRSLPRCRASPSQHARVRHGSLWTADLKDQCTVVQTWSLSSAELLHDLLQGGDQLD